jgi:hypothetical protein
VVARLGGAPRPRAISNQLLDYDALISRLAGPLSPPDRVAFRCGAEEVFSKVPCWGEGAVYRTVAALQRRFFDPPTFGRAHWDIGHEARPSRLKSAAPIAHAGDGRVVRYRKR